MPVDRKARDETAEALAGFLQGSLSEEQFGERLGEIKTDDEDVTGMLDFATDYLDLYEEGCPPQTDLTMETVETRVPAQTPAMARRVGWVMAAGILGGVCAGVAYHDWRIPVTAWVLAAAVNGLLAYTHPRGRPEGAKPPEAMAFDPFGNEETWRLHEHLLTEYELPATPKLAPSGPWRLRDVLLAMLFGPLALGWGTAILLAFEPWVPLLPTGDYAVWVPVVQMPEGPAPAE